MTGTTARHLVVPAVLAGLVVVGDAFAAGLLAGGGTVEEWLLVSAVALLGAALAGVALDAARLLRRRDRALHLAGRQLDELLRVSDSAQESKGLLIGHAQRVLPGAGAGILVLADGGDRLEPTLPEFVDRTPLRGIRAAGGRSSSCLAMRLRRSHARGPRDSPLVACDVCGALDAEIVCEPLVAGGETIGAVLVAHEGVISTTAREALRDAAARAAPILAGQRELAHAEDRAVNDALTGLPNRRAADEAIRRMVAHAGRSLSPLGVVLLDLDRFRILNDLHGHSHGDKALAAVGRLLAATIRASDFAARYGGEEFLLVLPDTDRHGSLELAEKIRRQIERTELVQTGPITASFGIACLPDDAVDPDQLVRTADRALYMAKAQGRNRVEAAEPSGRGAAPAS